MLADFLETPLSCNFFLIADKPEIAFWARGGELGRDPVDVLGGFSFWEVRWVFCTTFLAAERTTSGLSKEGLSELCPLVLRLFFVEWPVLG